MNPTESVRLELLEISIAEMDEELAAQAAEIGMLRELVIRLLQMLHLKGTVKLQEIAAASEAALTLRELGLEGMDNSMAPVTAKLLRDLAAKLDASGPAPGGE